MSPILLMLHGWSMDRSFWDPLAAALGEFEILRWDLGYFGAPEITPPPPERRIFAIGHSFGLLWLLHHRPFAWDRLVAINGFTRFLAEPDFPEGVNPAQWERLRAGLAQDETAAISGFHQRLGDHRPLPAPPRGAVLAQHLQHLRDWDQRGGKVDLALCGQRDRILPPAHSLACFDPAIIRWHGGGHLLPLEDPLWCAQQLRDWQRQ